MVGQVICDQSESVGNFGCFKEVSPLAAMTACGMLQEHRYAGASFLKVDAMFGAAQL